MSIFNNKIMIGLLVGALSVVPYVAYDGAREAPTQVKERSSESEIAYRGRRGGRRYGRRGYRRGGYHRGYRGGYRYRHHRYYRSPYYYNYGPDYYYYNRGYNRGYDRPRGGLYFQIGR